MTQELNKLIDYYKMDLRDYRRRIQEVRDEHQDYYYGRIDQVNVIIMDLERIRDGNSA